MKQFGKELVAGQSKALDGFAKLIAVIVILGVAAFGDVIYIIEMNRVFAGQGVLLVLCYIGAFTSFLAMAYLLIGKVAIFSDDGRQLASWCVFAIELVVIAMNIMLVTSGDRSQIMSVWSEISPFTPVIHMCGVAIIYFMDPNIKRRKKLLELEQERLEAEAQYLHDVGMAALDAKRQQLAHAVREIGIAVDNEGSQAQITEFAQTLTQKLLGEMAGGHIAPPRSRKQGNERGYGRY